MRILWRLGGLKWMARIGVLLILTLQSSCDRAKTATVSPKAAPTPAPNPLWVDVRISRSSDGFRTEDFVLLELRFKMLSGGISNYEALGMSLAVQAQSNGDRTITTSAAFNEETGNVIASGPVTAVEGQTTTHQVGETRFTINASTVAQTLANANVSKPDSLFAGDYVELVGGDSLELVRGRFKISGHPGPKSTMGRYHNDGESVFLSFDGPGEHTNTVHHRIVDGIHFLVDDLNLPYFEGGYPLPPGITGLIFIVRSEENQELRSKWSEAIDRHPRIANIFRNNRELRWAGTL